MGMSYCIDKISQEACKGIHKADLPLQDSQILDVTHP